MTPKEQGNKLTTQFYNLRAWDVMEVSERKIAYEIAKKCAIICVEQIMLAILPVGARDGKERTNEIYWEEVIYNIKNS